MNNSTWQADEEKLPDGKVIAELKLTNGCTALEIENNDFIYLRQPDGNIIRLDYANRKFFDSLTPEEILEFDRLWRYDARPDALDFED